MIELFEQDILLNDRQSSKGNQLKWQSQNGIWYKADYTGYEGLVEYLISCLLGYSSLIITLERLFETMKGESLTKSVYHMPDVRERIRYMVEQTEQLTGLREFGVYISKLMTIDALFLNEDRHTHNIAVLLDDCDQFHYCPIFDNGASLLSDTIQDYPMEEKIQDLVKRVKAKTFHDDFDEQLDTVEELYGRQIRFHFDRAIVEKIIAEEQNYSNDVKERVYDLISRQMRKYQYLFE